MVRKMKVLSLSVLLLFSFSLLSAQSQESNNIKHKIVKQNGVAFIGIIISQDAREILLETDDIGQVYIPKHEIKEIIDISKSNKFGGGDSLFASRYFLTTNGFPVKKGENYIQWNLFGPDFQFGVADNFGLGIMTSWVGLPIIGTAKYSRQLGENLSGGLGFLGGTGSWAYPDYGLLLPFGFLTLGNPVNNINLSFGYGGLFMERTENHYTLTDESSEWQTNGFRSTSTSSNKGEGRPLISLAAMFKINNKFSFVFDSFIMTGGTDRERQRIKYSYDDQGIVTHRIETEKIEKSALVVIAPGLRFQATHKSSFQFGFTGLRIDGEFLPVPIPMVQWFRAI